MVGPMGDCVNPTDLAIPPSMGRVRTELRATIEAYPAPDQGTVPTLHGP